MEVTSGLDAHMAEAIHLALRSDIKRVPEVGAWPQIPYNPSLHLVLGRSDRQVSKLQVLLFS